jgi:hypothetical protein
MKLHLRDPLPERRVIRPEPHERLPGQIGADAERAATLGDSGLMSGRAAAVAIVARRVDFKSLLSSDGKSLLADKREDCVQRAKRDT